MTDNHPQIPQGHPRFRNRDGVDEFDIGWRYLEEGTAEDIEDWQPINTIIGHRMRQDCACVARCAFIDEAEAHDDAFCKTADDAEMLISCHKTQTADFWRAWMER